MTGVQTCVFRSENLTTKINKISDDSISFISLQTQDGSETGYRFTGVPGGHEFTSFVLTIYNYSGKGQAMEAHQVEKISSIKDKKNVKIVVSLSCTKCPDLVTATSQIMSKLDGSNFEVFDIAYAFEFREKYNIMSVPCTIINSCSSNSRTLPRTSRKIGRASCRERV